MILVAEAMPEAGLERLRAAGHDVCYEPELGTDPERLPTHVPDAEALIVRNRTQVDEPLLAHAPALRVVGRLGAGLDNLDLAALERRGIAVVDAKGANAASVAEYVLGALLFLARRIDRAAEHVAQNGWDRMRFGGVELGPRTLGLVGLGDIGVRVAWRARSFGMRVLASDPARDPTEALVAESGIHLVPLATLLAESEAVSLHAPLTDQTHHLIRQEELARMRSDAWLINTSRGELVDGEALARALREEELAGAVLDVTEPEPLPTDHPLREAPNVWITPHVAGLTHDAQTRVGERVADGVLEALEASNEHARSA